MGWIRDGPSQLAAVLDEDCPTAWASACILSANPHTSGKPPQLHFLMLGFLCFVPATRLAPGCIKDGPSQLAAVLDDDCPTAPTRPHTISIRVQAAGTASAITSPILRAEDIALLAKSGLVRGRVQQQKDGLSGLTWGVAQGEGGCRS